MEKKEAFNPLMPGLDFMQNWFKGASNAIPGVGQWVTPTLDPEELKKRIQELKTIQFWLEQNSRMVGATIQALEVQCMTLSTLQTMNIKMADLQASLKVKPESDSPATDKATDKKPGKNRSIDAQQTDSAKSEKTESPAPGMAVDPLKWWGSLTEQFTQIATQALKEPAAAAAAAASAVNKAATSAVKQAAAAVQPQPAAGAKDAAPSPKPTATKKVAAKPAVKPARQAAAPRKPRV